MSRALGRALRDEKLAKPINHHPRGGDSRMAAKKKAAKKKATKKKGAKKKK